MNQDSCRFLTCYNLSELRVQVDRAGEEGADVSSRQHWGARGKEHLETPHISIYLQQRLYIFSGGNVLGNPVTQKDIYTYMDKLNNLRKYNLQEHSKLTWNW